MQTFNKKPNAGIDKLILSKKCNGDPDDIAKFLLKTEGLNMRMIGDYLGKIAEFNGIVLRAYIRQLDFADQVFYHAVLLSFGCQA
eukprot:COSAG01_NODE_1622_length_9712_cov_40.535005_2_plen_85_part_00